MTLPCDGIPLGWVTRHCEGALRQGLGAEELLEGVQIDPGGGSAEIGAAQYMLFAMNNAWHVEDALHGLGQDRIRIGNAALGIRVMLGCATLEGALRAIERFYAQATSSAQMHLGTEGEWARISFVSNSPIMSADGIVEDMAIAWLFMCASRFLGRALPVVEVQVRDHQHFNLGGRHWAVKAPVRLGRTSGLRFSKRLLAVRRGGAPADDALWPCVRAWLSFIGTDDPAAALVDVTDHLAAPVHRLHLPAGRAERQRVLTDRGLLLLRDSDDSVDAVAAELGYSDARSFRRFIKASTGLTPQQIRQRPGTEDPTYDVARRIEELARLMDPGSGGIA